MYEIICLIMGFIFLIMGTKILIIGSSDIARRFKISVFAIGITVIAFVTSMPELAVSIKAAMDGLDNIVIYNIIGSNIINILLILGTICIFKPLQITSNTITKELPLCIVSSILLCLLGLDDIFIKNADNILSKTDSIILIIFFLVYTYYMITIIKKRRDIKIIEKPNYSIIRALLYSILGIAMVIMGSIFTVDMANKVVIMGINQRVLSLLVIAFATSLPEFTACISALKSKQDDLIIGNILGSNIFNICICLSIPAIIVGNLNMNGLSIVDLANFVIAVLILLVFGPIKNKIGKIEGIIMLSIFLIYYVYIILEGVFL